MARAKYIDPDFRRQSKSPDYCVACGRALNARRLYRIVRLIGGGFYVVHPDDVAAYVAGAEVSDADSGQALVDEMREDNGEEKLGIDCARRIGLEWSRPVDGARHHD